MKSTNRTQSDHIFATGFRTNLGQFALDFDGIWPELADAFRAAHMLAQTPPFRLSVVRSIPRPDAHSITFGSVLSSMRHEIQMLLQTAFQHGNDAAKTSHKSRLLVAWQRFVDAVEDLDAANLAPQHQHNQINQGRQTLLQIKFDIMDVINCG